MFFKISDGTHQSTYVPQMPPRIPGRLILVILHHCEIRVQCSGRVCVTEKYSVKTTSPSLVELLTARAFNIGPIPQDDMGYMKLLVDKQEKEKARAVTLPFR